MNENEEQKCIFTWAAWEIAKYPELELLHHIPNGGKRNAREAANLKKQGVKAGVPDMCLPVARGGFHGLYIELKRKKGGSLSDYQKKWINQLNEQGYKAVVCHGADEAIKEIEGYLSRKE